MRADGRHLARCRSRCTAWRMRSRFNYRGNPLVQQARGMIARGEAGRLELRPRPLPAGLAGQPRTPTPGGSDPAPRAGASNGARATSAPTGATSPSTSPACGSAAGTRRPHDRHSSALFYWRSGREAFSTGKLRAARTPVHVRMRKISSRASSSVLKTARRVAFSVGQVIARP